MFRPNDLPRHRRITLDEFLAFTGWQLRPGTSPVGMQVALDFYQDHIDRSTLLAHVPRPSPWSLPAGNVLKLSELMQAIDFSQRVERLVAAVNERFKSFRPRHEPKDTHPRGNWFTHLSTDQRTVAIPGDQDAERVYRVRTPVEYLKSTASDAFTWIRKTHEQVQAEPVGDRYFRGGGRQCFIWRPERYLELV